MLSSQDLSIYKLARTSAVYRKVTEWGLIRISGSDRATFLQGQSSNDVKKLPVGSYQLNSFLTVKGRIRAMATVYNSGDAFYLLLEKDLVELVADHLEKYIILEDVKLHKQVDSEFFFISGPKSANVLEELGILEQGISIQEDSHPSVSLFFEVPFSGDKAFVVVPKNESFQKSLSHIECMSHEVFSTLLDEGAFLRHGRDISEKVLLPETGLQARCVSYDKGCFVGQEIVARVKSRGSVNRSLAALIFEANDSLPCAGDSLLYRGRKGADITHVFYSPFLEADVGFAYMNKNCRSPEATYLFETDSGQSVKAKVRLLPLYQTEARRQRARAFFDEAMEFFVQDQAGEQKAAELLRSAIDCDPKFADAYETLGVVLSRQERFDEAIELMKHLREISPEEVMAATNLSLFYMKKGMIAEAEEEKTQATILQFKRAAKERKERQAEETAKAQEREELKRRRDMFYAVLEIDEDDLVANFGLGKLALDEERFEDAVSYFEKCIVVKKDYSVAFLHLGQSLEKVNLSEKAAEIYKTGIEVASIQGDMMPQKEMERRLLLIVNRN